MTNQHQVQRWTLSIAGLWIICCILGWIIQPAQFYRSYLFAWLFWLGVSLGSLGLVMMHHLIGGEWGMMIRRFGENAAMVLPLLIVLFIPIPLGMHWLYRWSRADVVAADVLIQHKQPYLNVAFFLARSVIYFAVWLALAWYLRSGSLRRDRTADPVNARHLYNASAGGMVAYFLTMSLASVDWIMSRDPEWHSTVFGFIIVCGQGISALCLLIIFFALVVDRPPFKGLANADHFNDLGNLLMTFVILWAYMAFAQLLVQWMGNKQDEMPWYVQRLSNGWAWIGLAIVVLHFFVPFIVLLMRQAKRRVRIMLWLCVVLLILRLVDLFWMVAPSGEETHPLLRHSISWMDFVFPMGMGAAWLSMFMWLTSGHPLMVEGETVPLADARGA